MRNGFTVIDVDGHVVPDEMADWSKYMPAEVARDVTERSRARAAALGAMRAVTAEDKAKGFVDRVQNDVSWRDGGWVAASRLVDMDADGIDVAVLFPTMVASGATEYAHPIETTRGYHDWLAEYCSVSPGRLKGVCSVALVEDLEAATREMVRCVEELGFVGVMAKVHSFGRTLADPVYADFFAEAERLDVPVLVHLGGDVRYFLREKYRYPWFQEMSYGNPASSMIGLMDIICGGWLERFKRLRFGLMEGEISWLPAWIDRLDRRYEKLPHHAPLLTKKPSEYLKDERIFISCEAEEAHLPYVLDTWAEDMALFNSDYPHWDAAISGTVDELLARSDVTDVQKRKILCDNALRLLYGDRAAEMHPGERAIGSAR
jgi:predicted TIM-barrel fold metal-dependent hydrolase